MLLEIFEHDIFVADEARLGSGATGLHMLVVLALRPTIFAVFAVFWFSRANLIMRSEQFWLDHLVTHRALLFFMEFFLSKCSIYIMLLLIFDIDHFATVLALAYVAAAVSFMQIYAIDWEGLVTVGTLLGLGLNFHLQLLFKFTNNFY